FLFLISFKISSIVIFNIAQFCLSFGRSLRIVLYVLLNLINCLFNFFGRDFFKAWWVSIGIIFIISNRLCVFPHLFQGAFHILFIILYRFTPYKSIASCYRFYLGAIGIHFF